MPLRDKLKFKEKDGVTAAQDLEAYLHENGFDNFYLLTDALKDKEYGTYNNTENSVLSVARRPTFVISQWTDVITSGLISLLTGFLIASSRK